MGTEAPVAGVAMAEEAAFDIIRLWSIDDVHKRRLRGLCAVHQYLADSWNLKRNDVNSAPGLCEAFGYLGDYCLASYGVCTTRLPVQSVRMKNPAYQRFAYLDLASHACTLPSTFRFRADCRDTQLRCVWRPRFRRDWVVLDTIDIDAIDASGCYEK